jgi:chemotaxis protein MotB
LRRMMIVSAALVAGCGVSQAQHDAKSLEAENYRRQYQDESGKAEALAEKVAELTRQLQESEKSCGDMEQTVSQLEEREQKLRREVKELTALNESLAKSKEKLAQAKEALEKKSEQYESLARSLKDEIRTGKIELSELRGRMVVKMKDKILFSSGSVKINADGQAALAKVAEALKGVDGKIIRVEGHTDDIPTDPKGPFPSNWELSSTRALAVVHLLQEKGVSPALLSASGYGEHHPIASNKTPNGRSLNRRIEIVLAPAELAPGKTAKKR